jgi:hypothetical protein
MSVNSQSLNCVASSYDIKAYGIRKSPCQPLDIVDKRSQRRPSALSAECHGPCRSTRTPWHTTTAQTHPLRHGAFSPHPRIHPKKFRRAYCICVESVYDCVCRYSSWSPVAEALVGGLRMVCPSFLRWRESPDRERLFGTCYRHKSHLPRHILSLAEYPLSANECELKQLRSAFQLDGNSTPPLCRNFRPRSKRCEPATFSTCHERKR